MPISENPCKRNGFLFSAEATAGKIVLPTQKGRRWNGAPERYYVNGSKHTDAAMFLCLACGSIHARGACPASRKYQLTKVRSGDWLLPSNDGRWLFRLYSGNDGWEVYRMVMPTTDAELDALADDVQRDEWAEWEYRDGPLSSRADAIDAALRS